MEFIYFVELVSKKSNHLQHYAWSLILTINFKSLLKEQNSTNILLILSDKTVIRLAHHRFSQKMNGRICFACFFLLFTANKSNSSIRFLGESTARPSSFRFYLTFSLDFQKLLRLNCSRKSPQLEDFKITHCYTKSGTIL